MPLAVAAVLALPILAPGATVQAMAFAMGGLNAAMDHAGSVKVSATYVTGTPVKVGRGLGRLLLGEETGWGWLQQGTSWLGLLGGAVGGGACIDRFPGTTVAGLPLVPLAIAIGFRSFAVRGSRQDLAKSERREAVAQSRRRRHVRGRDRGRRRPTIGHGPAGPGRPSWTCPVGEPVGRR